MGASCVASCSHTWWSNADADGRREPSVCMHVCTSSTNGAEKRSSGRGGGGHSTIE